MSTVTLQSVDDYVAAQGKPTPLSSATSGFGPMLALEFFNGVMRDLIDQRFNWKWNRATAPPIYTNSWQQDYPQPGNTDIGWLEEMTQIQINSTSYPLPLWGSPDTSVYRQLSRTRNSSWRPNGIAWMYNQNLSYGNWPGATVTLYPLILPTPQTQTQQNPYLTMIDKNGNRLIVTGFGVTGTVAPFLPPSSAEGTTVTDGSVTWSVVAATSIGFRLNAIPSGTQPVFQILTDYQMKPQVYTTTAFNTLTLGVIPDDQAPRFREGYDCYCLKSSPNPGDRARFLDQRTQWLNSMETLKSDADHEQDSYSLIPANYPVDRTWGDNRNPNDPSQPY